MDAPEISTLREEEEETPPPEGDGGGLSFSKFRLNSVRLPSWGQPSSASGSAVGPPVGPHPAGRRGPSPPDSEEEDEEDQLIDDDELPMLARGPATSSPASMATGASPPPSTTGSRKRGGGVRGARRRGAATGRRGRPGREPPDAAAMMSTFEVGKAAEQAPPVQILPPVSVPHPPLPQIPGPSTGDWSTSTPPKPPRKKPGPKKGTTLGPRGPRKASQK